MVPSGFIAKLPSTLLVMCPASVPALTALSVSAKPNASAVPISVNELTDGSPEKPPDPLNSSVPFQTAFSGSQTSTPIPADVEGAPAGPGLPGPMLSLTRHRLKGAVFGAGLAGVPESAIGSPVLKALTKVTVVSS